MPVPSRAERVNDTAPVQPAEPRTPAPPAPAQLLALQRSAGNVAVARLLAASREHPTSLGGTIMRKGGGAGGGTATGNVGIPGGESPATSDLSGMAAGYNKRPDGQYDTPDARVVSEAQATDESKVINSDGIYMAAYLARYEHVKSTHGLTEAQLDKLSAGAGFMKQYKTGDVVLRLMDANDSAGIAQITDSHYSHSGIVQVTGGRVWVLDSYPTTGGARADATARIRFEDFFADHHGEKIVNGLVLRIQTISDQIRTDISALIDKYELKVGSFDYAFKFDNGDAVLYCSELVYKILQEAAVSTLPPNEFAQTQARVETLIPRLKAMIALMKSQGSDTSRLDTQLAILESKLAEMKSATDPQLFSPGSVERSGMTTLTGFKREGDVEGTFKVTIQSGTVPDDWDTPDPYVVVSGGVAGETPVQDDTVSPVWNTAFTGIAYGRLKDVTFKVRDSDLVVDDDIATITADIRPVRPAGQTFALSSGSTTLSVKVEGEGDTASVAGQAVRDTTPM
jgi:hypothetical protein